MAAFVVKLGMLSTAKEMSIGVRPIIIIAVNILVMAGLKGTSAHIFGFGNIPKRAEAFGVCYLRMLHSVLSPYICIQGNRLKYL